MASPVGLLVVHGIGNQRAGELCSQMAERLADEGVVSARKPAVPPADGAETAPVHEIRVGDTPVLVHEANWAILSHPDNPPRVRDSSDVIPEFYRTVRAAWRFAGRSQAKDDAGASGRAQDPLVVWFCIAVAVTVLGAASVMGVRLASQVPQPQRDVLTGALGLAAFLALFSSVCRSVRSWRAGSRVNGHGRLRSLLVDLPGAMLWGLYRPFVKLWGAELLVLFAVPVLVAYPVNLLGRLLTYPFRGAGRLFSRLRLPFLTRWVHRLGWVIIVLPVHSYLQAVKATGNLFSIAFSDEKTSVKAMAVVGLSLVLCAFLVLALISELLLIVPVAIVLPDAGSGSGWFQPSDAALLGFFAVLLPLYLVLLRLFLPVLDAILDISNYHLASQKEREQYLAPIERGMATLLRCGCREIHVLAHSLGTVIMYDWFRSREPGSCPVTTLHTIGSPLDKFWYIDHTQTRRREDRDGLQERVSRCWVNYWAFSDPVSGTLAHYDAPGLRTANERLPWLGPFFWSHVRYWKNRTVIAGIRERIRTAAAQG